MTSNVHPTTQPKIRATTMAATPTSEPPMVTLRHTVSSTVSLLAQFQSSLSNKAPSSPPSANNKNNDSCLAMLHKSTTVIKAQVTKLSLLLINEPFSPTALTTVLQELSTGALLALMNAVELCSPRIWGTTFSEEVRRRTRRLLRELSDLVRDIPLEKKAQEQQQQQGQQRQTCDESKEVNGGPRPKDNLFSIGVVWEACDALLELQTKGVAGVVMEKVQDYHDMIEDAITELRNWSKESVEDDSQDDIDHNDAHSADEENGFEDIFQPDKALSKDNTELRAQLESTLKRLTLVRMLYKVIIKRRLRSFVPVLTTTTTTSADASSDEANNSVTTSTRLDLLMRDLEFIQEETDELASAFYELDGLQAAERLDQCLDAAKRAASLMKPAWDGSSDEFTPWIERWLVMIDKQ